MQKVTGILTTALLLFTQLLVVPAAQAAMMDNETVLAKQQRTAMENDVMALMDHDAAAKVLSKNGVTEEQVSQRLSHLSDAELQQLAHKADTLPDGEGVVGVILAVILILILLDLLGATDVFPVIRPLG